MEIALLADMVKELILDNDEVTLPGLGTFVTEVVPSSFSDRGYTINPPYRRLSFREKHEPDDRLANFYSRINGTDFVTSEKIISQFVAEIKEELRKKKVVVFPGLGRLRATKENAFFFIPDEDLEIYPYGFGLEPVSLKTHEETPEEVHSAVEKLGELVEAAAPEPVAEPVPAAKPEAPAEATAEPVGRPKKNHTAMAVTLSILGAVVLFFAIFIILAHTAPDFIDNLLYTPEQLKIINTPLE